MYFTPRGRDERPQRSLDCVSSQKFLEIAVSHNNFKDFFQHFHIKTIAIAPFNHFGKCLARLLQDADVELMCFADRTYYLNRNMRYCNASVESYDSNTLKKADVVVVTSNFYFNDIVDTLTEKGVPLENIIGLNSILFGMERLETE